jgi:hypothetical protein
VTTAAALLACAIGTGLGMALSVFATATRLDRSRAFYPTLLIVIASYYCLFAVMGDSVSALVVETVIAGGFILLSAFGFKINLWLVVCGLVAHGTLDFVHASLIHNPGVPRWWPMFCSTIDVTMGIYLAWRLRRRAFDAATPGG